MKLSIYCGKSVIVGNPYMVFTDCNTSREFVDNKRFKDLTIVDGEWVDHIDRDASNSFSYKIFLKENDSKNPKWWNFIFDGIQGDARRENPLTKYCSGIILLKCFVNDEQEERVFIITFGSGSSYIEDSAIEENFGLKVVLNSISVQNLHLVDKKNIGSNTRQVKEAYSSPTNVKNFDINQIIDKLTFVEGSPQQQDQQRLGKKIGGRDAVIVDMGISFFNLGKLCKIYYQCFLGDDYRDKGFGFIDNYTSKIDTDIIVQLNNILRNAITNDRGNISISPKDIIQMIEQITEFEVSIGRDSQLFTVLNFDEIYDFIVRNGRITDLQSFEEKVKIQGQDVDGNNLTSKASLKKYLVYETILDNQQYVLHEGVRYNIQQDYYTNIQSRISEMQDNDILNNAHYLRYDTSLDTGEGTYNSRQGNERGFYCIDKDLFRGFDTGIEVGDLLYSINNEYHLIHIKKYRCSATLSHLFAQGKVSHEALKRDENYFNYLRDSFTTGFPEGVGPADKDDIKTVFGIITTKHSLNELPFFSKINLINTVDNISKLNGVVKFVFIPIS